MQSCNQEIQSIQTISNVVRYFVIKPSHLTPNSSLNICQKHSGCLHPPSTLSPSMDRRLWSPGAPPHGPSAAPLGRRSRPRPRPRPPADDGVLCFLGLAVWRMRRCAARGDAPDPTLLAPAVPRLRPRPRLSPATACRASYASPRRRRSRPHGLSRPRPRTPPATACRASWASPCGGCGPAAEEACRCMEPGVPAPVGHRGGLRRRVRRGVGHARRGGLRRVFLANI